MGTRPSLTIGLEEELFLVEQKSGKLVTSWPKALIEICEKEFSEKVVREFIKAQVEIVSSPQQTVNALHQQVAAIRLGFINQAKSHGLALMASSTHPLAQWRKQKSVRGPRYDVLADELRVSASRLLVGGMHIHIGIDDPALRLHLLNCFIPYLPWILSLSASSPFWSGFDTGFASYRANVLKGLPRSGLPPLFKSYDEHQHYMQSLIEGKAIRSGRELWWDIRLSSRFPTIEVRIGDSCTKLEDAMAIVALVQSLMHYLYRQETQPLTSHEYWVSKENRWRAQRYPLEGVSFLNAKTNELEALNQSLPALIDELKVDAKELDCEDYLSDCLRILKQGTSSEHQRTIYQQAIEQGATSKEAIEKVCHHLVLATEDCQMNRQRLLSGTYP